MDLQGRGDGDVGERHIAKAVEAAGGLRGNAINDVQTLRHLAKDRVAWACGALEIQELVVHQIHKKLGGGRVGFGGAGHGDRAAQVGGAVFFGLQNDRRALPGFFDQACGIATGLHDKAGDHAVEQRLGVVAAVDIAQKIVDRDGRIGWVQLQDDGVAAGGQQHLGLGHGQGGGIHRVALGGLDGEHKVAHLGYFAIEHRHIGRAGAGKAGGGAGPAGIDLHGVAQVGAAQVDGGRAPVLQRGDLDGRDLGFDVAGAAATTGKNQGQAERPKKLFIHRESASPLETVACENAAL